MTRPRHSDEFGHYMRVAVGSAVRSGLRARAALYSSSKKRFLRCAIRRELEPKADATSDAFYRSVRLPASRNIANSLPHLINLHQGHAH